MASHDHMRPILVILLLTVSSPLPLRAFDYVMPVNSPLPKSISFDLVCAERFDGEIFWRGLWIDDVGRVHLYSGPDSLRMHQNGRTLTSEDLWLDRFATMDTVVTNIPILELDSMLTLAEDAQVHPMTGLLEHTPYVTLVSYSAYLPQRPTGEPHKILLYLDAGADRIRAGKPSRTIQMWLWQLWQKHWNRM